MPIIAYPRAEEKPPSALTIVAHEGRATPIGGIFTGAEGASCFSYVDLNDAGDVVFQAEVSNIGESKTGIFLCRGETGEIVGVASEGDQSPLGTEVREVLSPRLNSGGDVLYTAFYHTPPTPEEMEGHEVLALIQYSGGDFNTRLDSERVISRVGDLQGYMIRWHSFDVNNRGDVVLDGTIAYFNTSKGHLGPTGRPDEYENGVYLLPAGQDQLLKVLINGEELQDGRYVGGATQQGDSVRITDIVEPSRHGGPELYVARASIIEDPPGVYDAGALLLINVTGLKIHSIAEWGSKITWENAFPGEENEIEVQGLTMVDLNVHGQLAFIAMEPDVGRHFLVYSEGKIFRIAGHLDEAPVPRSGMRLITDYNVIVAAINDNMVPLGLVEGGYSVESVLMAHVSDYPWMSPGVYQDVYSYTSDELIHPVVLGATAAYEGQNVTGGDPAPDPPGGVVVLGGWGERGWMMPSLALNNNGEVAVNGFTYTPNGGFVSALMLASLDADGDGLPNSWEERGIDMDQDGVPELDLPRMGADPLHKDLFIEVDYMANVTLPLQSAFGRVVTAFSKAPVSNPDGEDGINLHIVVDEEIPFKESLSMWKDFDQIKKDYFGSEEERANLARIEARRLVFRYCVFANDFNGSITGALGLSELPGNDFACAFGHASANRTISRFGLEEVQASVFMHELGHTLGLKHGGVDHINCKPNYLSIMSYSRTLPWFVTSRSLDYSRKTLRTLDENSLNEHEGVGDYWPHETVYFIDTNNDTINDRFKVIGVHGGPIDWDNDDAIETNVKTRLNSLADPPAGTLLFLQEFPYEVLVSFDDWSNIVYGFRHTEDYAEYSHATAEESELTWNQADAMIEFEKLMRPLAVIRSNATEAVIGSAITFDASGSTAHGGASIEYYFFDFGDGRNSSWVTFDEVTYEYTSEGVFNASLVVLDEFGVVSLNPTTISVKIDARISEGDEPEPQPEPEKPSGIPGFPTESLLLGFLLSSLLLFIGSRRHAPVKAR